MSNSIKKKCSVIILPTDKATNIYQSKNGKLNYSHNKGSNTSFKTYIHLYITSDDKIEEGDWYLGEDNIVYNLVTTVNFNGRKIIATTDKYLNLPQISQSFVKEYCDKGGIDEVMVEFEYDEVATKFRNAEIKGVWEKYLPKNGVFKPKLNSDNEISIHSTKNNFTREEVEKLIKKSVEDFSSMNSYLEENLNEWLKDNL